VAATTLYVTADELKTTLRLSGTTFADADVDVACEAASRAVDEYCARWFYAPDPSNEETTRYYTPDGPVTLYIDDLLAAEDAVVAVDTTGAGGFTDEWVVGTDFEFEPANAEAGGQPYTRLVCRAPRRWPTGYRRSVAVTGQYGWAAVPGPVVAATGILAARLMRRAREAPFGIVVAGIDQASAVRIARSDPDVAALLDPYSRQVVL